MLYNLSHYLSIAGLSPLLDVHDALQWLPVVTSYLQPPSVSMAVPSAAFVSTVGVTSTSWLLAQTSVGMGNLPWHRLSLSII